MDINNSQPQIIIIDRPNLQKDLAKEQYANPEQRDEESEEEGGEEEDDDEEEDPVDVERYAKNSARNKAASPTASARSPASASAFKSPRNV